MWSKSIHEAEIKFAQGTASFASRENKSQGTTWEKYYTPYALFKTYMVYNDKCAKRQDINVTEEDIESFKDILVAGIRNYKSTSKNQMPRVLVEVVYNRNYIDGEAIRSIDEFTFDFTELVNFVELHNDVVKKVIVYLHPKVNVENLSEKFNVKYI